MNIQTKNNFTLSTDWINSVYLRYDIDKILEKENLIFALEDDTYKCLNYFNIDLLKKLNGLKDVFNSNKVKFSYLDDFNEFDELVKWVNQNGYNIEISDEWTAPMLICDDDIETYLINNNHKQIQRNYKKYKKYISEYKILNSKYDDLLEMWKYVLEIDHNSWKYNEHSDMKSLNREDLQYYPYMEKNKDKISLIVLLKNNIPNSYSLMFKTDTYWYQVKWGASENGRNEYAGFYVLFYHLEYLYKIENKLHLDFWGRRNITYDKLSNSSLKRRHIIIRND